MLAAENPYKYKTPNEITPSDRVLSEIIHKAISVNPEQMKKMLELLASQTCKIRETCEDKKPGSCSIKCAE
ncbi:MAG: hypothetical protein Q8934_18470 [Bacillota bacterium]|nr:hypothetical protein [Bacillota bacterium]